jgi:protein involved in temperature-dependent protein secretion
LNICSTSRSIDLWYHRIGQAHLAQSRIDESIRWLERGHRANPASPTHHAWLAAAYALKGDTERAAFELTEVRRLSGDDRYSSIARLQTSGFFAVATIRTLFEPLFLPGCATPECQRNERSVCAKVLRYADMHNRAKRDTEC